VEGVGGVEEAEMIESIVSSPSDELRLLTCAPVFASLARAII
jgi:hypothetical protein